MLRVEMLPAGHGDALLVEWGDERSPRRMLVDGGPWYAYDEVRARLDRIPLDQREFELLVVTHVDSDHVDGIIRLLHEPKQLGFRFNDVWFNGWKHLRRQVPGLLAGQQGEFLGALLERDGLPWNQAFGGNAVAVDPVAGPPTIELAGGLALTLLSPFPENLEALRPQWETAVKKAGFQPGDTRSALEQLARRARYKPPVVLGAEPDHSEANGSSIAFVAEHGGKRLLLAGDAWPRVLERALARLSPETRQVDAFKLSHHGSFGNCSRQLVETLAARTYLVSTNGSYYQHPEADTLDMILRRHPQPAGKPHLCFNYESAWTLPWLDPSHQTESGYTATLVAGRPVLLV